MAGGLVLVDVWRISSERITWMKNGDKRINILSLSQQCSLISYLNLSIPTTMARNMQMGRQRRKVNRPNTPNRRHKEFQPRNIGERVQLPHRLASQEQQTRRWPYKGRRTQLTLVDNGLLKQLTMNFILTEWLITNVYRLQAYTV